VHQDPALFLNGGRCADEYDVDRHTNGFRQAERLEVDVRDVLTDGMVLHIAKDRQVGAFSSLYQELDGSTGSGAPQCL